jgi:hypothetical protein
MKSHCHSCGREYLTARALAGQAVACRSCGALYDGAGGPPPAQEQAKRRAETERRDPATGARKARTGEPRIQSGAAFTVGGTPKAADPKKLAEIEVGAMREKLAVAESVQGWRGSRVVFALGIGAASVAALIVAGIFTYRELVKPDKGIDWVPSQRAVASVTSPAADGGAFLVESNGELWLVTTLDLVAGATEISATFRDPAIGAELLRLAGIRSKDMWVDRRLFVGSAGETETDRNAPYFAVAAANVEMYRPQIEALAIEPLEIAEQSDVAMGAKVVALGQVSEQGASQAPLHALFDGTVSFIKSPNKGPAYLQTSARFEDGCIGGPLLLESTREIVGVQLDPFVSSYRRLAIMGDEIHEVLENGIQLGGVRKVLESDAASVTASEENVELSDLEDLPLYHEFEDELLALQTNGWRPQRPKMLLTDKDGIVVLTHEVLSQPEAQVAVLLLSPSPVVPIEVGSFDSPQGKLAASELGGNGASLRVIGVKDSTGDQLVMLPEAFLIGVGLRTTFLGQPLQSGVVCVVLERDPNAAPASQTAPAQPTIPSTPPTTPTTPPAQPPAQTPQPPTQPPTVAPPSPPAPPVVIPPPSAGGMASIVEFVPLCNDEVFASSILGMTAFDEKWLAIDPATGTKDLQPLVQALRAELDPTGAEDDQTKLMKSVRLASLGYSTWTFNESRPVFNTSFNGIPTGAKVAIHAEVRPHGSLELLPVGKPFLVSVSTDTIPSDLSGSVPLKFPWNSDRLHQVRAPIDLSIELIAKYEDGTEDRGLEQIRVLPVSDVEAAYPCGLAWATLVDEAHPYVQKIINNINQQPELVRESVSLTGAGGDESAQILSAYLVWKELVRRGLRYQNLTGSSVLNAQRTRTVHESLCDRNANCVDGAVLFASFLKAMGFKTYIVLLPGHALVAAQVDGGPTLFIETTVLGTPVASDQSTAYDAEFRAITNAYRFVRNDPTLYQFEAACAVGNAAFSQGLSDAEQALAEWNAVCAKGDPQLPDGSWRPDAVQALMKLSAQLLTVDVDQARALGVRPIGIPPDLEQRYPLPK